MSRTKAAHLEALEGAISALRLREVFNAQMGVLSPEEQSGFRRARVFVEAHRHALQELYESEE